jgi:Spy/CpxP family protein refolding chaperone
MKNRIALPLIVLALISFSISVAGKPVYQMRGSEDDIQKKEAPPLEDRLKKLYEDLELSNEQKTKISELVKQLLYFYIEYHKEADDLRLTQEELKYSPYTTREEYNSKIDKFTVLEIQWQKSRLDHFFAVKEILDSGQWEDFTDEYFETKPFDTAEPGFGRSGENDGRMPGGMRPPDGGSEGAPPDMGSSGGANRGFGGMRGGSPRDMKKLGVYAMFDLSNDQRDVIKRILDELNSEKDKVDEILENMDEDIELQQTQEPSDETSVFQKIEQREQKEGDWEKISFSYHMRIMQILTTDQKNEIYDRMMEMLDRMKSRRENPPMMEPRYN